MKTPVVFFFVVVVELVQCKCLHTRSSDTVLSEVGREGSVVEEEHSANAFYLGSYFNLHSRRANHGQFSCVLKFAQEIHRKP